jgi:hypothetical protein
MLIKKNRRAAVLFSGDPFCICDGASFLGGKCEQSAKKALKWAKRRKK